MDTAQAIAAWVEENWQADLTLAEWWQRLADSGHAFPTWPTGLGGTNASPSQARQISAALTAAGVIGPPVGNGPSMGGPTVLAHGTPEQQQRFVGPLVRGQEAWAQLFSEPGAGSDLASLATSAVRDGDEFVINGQKVWNSFADMADWGMLLARTDVDVPKHRGITYMMIDMNQAGVEVRPLVQMNGIAEFCEVFFTDARVPVANVIGGIGEGWNVARTTLAFERAGAGSSRAANAISVGAGPKAGNLHTPVGELLQRAKRDANDPTLRTEMLLSSRTLFKMARELGCATDPVLRDRLMHYHINSQVYSWTGQRGRDNAKTGRPGPEVSTLKLKIALLAHESRDLSLSLLGAEGMLMGGETFEGARIQRAALASPVPSLGGGTNEIQRNIIGEQALGLPREPSDDNVIPFRELRRS
ncbi:MAG: acyl-CoA dehydrogenase family protein [Actinomycetota bacterium]|nr:acyl-CoA dehydrogenase family protein [Actinomycetota bacterium]